MEPNNVMDNSVAMAAIALAATSVAGIIWLAKYFAKELSKDLKAHTDAAKGQTDSNMEMLKFMKNLNGRLESAVIHKKAEIKQQNVEHQHVREN